MYTARSKYVVRRSTWLTSLVVTPPVDRYWSKALNLIAFPSHVTKSTAILTYLNVEGELALPETIIIMSSDG